MTVFYYYCFVFVGMKNREDREKEYFSNDFNPTTNVFMEEEEENFEELYDKVQKTNSCIL